MAKTMNPKGKPTAKKTKKSPRATYAQVERWKGIKKRHISKTRINR